MLRLMTMRAFAVSAIVLALSACTSDDPSAPDGPSSDSAAGLETAAVRPVADGGEALASGVLRLDPKSGCLWLEQPDGATRTPLLLAGEDYRVDFSADPPSVRDDGKVVARVGEQVDVGGGFPATDDGVRNCPVEGPAFLGHF